MSNSKVRPSVDGPQPPEVRFPYGYVDAERTIDVPIRGGKTVRVWLDARKWDAAKAQHLAAIILADRDIEAASLSEMIDRVAALGGGATGGVNAVQAQIMHAHGVMHTEGGVAYLVPFDDEVRKARSAMSLTRIGAVSHTTIETERL
jgi:hypothetical protein